MKHSFRWLALLVLTFNLQPSTFNLYAQSVVTATYAVTNSAGTANGNTVTVQGTTYLWTNAPNSLSHITNSGSPTGAATNLYNKFRTALTNRFMVNYGSSTSVVVRTFVGQTITSSINTGWGLLTFATNTAGNASLGASNLHALSITLSGTTIDDWTDVGAASIADGSLTTNKVDANFHTLLTTGGVGGTSGALTNNETRDVVLTSDLNVTGEVTAGEFSGNGFNITGLNGANINDSTISSNKMDATAHVAYKNDVTQAGLAAGSFALKTSAWLNKPSGLATNYSSLSAAKTASAAGDIITSIAMNVGATNLLKNGVDYDLRGVTLTHSNQIPQSAGLSLSIFDDRGQGAVTNTIKGLKLIDYRSQVLTTAEALTETNPFVNINAYGPVYITNPATSLRLQVDQIQHSIVGNLNNSAAIWIVNTSFAEIDVGEIIDPLALSPQAVIGKDEFDEDVSLNSEAAGVYWEHGETTARIGRIYGFGYGFYGDQNNVAGTLSVENYWHSGDLIHSTGNPAIYTVGTNTGFRMWFEVLELRSDGGQVISLFGTQRFYLLKNSKISTTKSGAFAISLASTGSPEAWINSQKVTSTNGGFVWLDSQTTGRLDITCQEYFDTGTAGTAIGYLTESGTNYIHGGRAKITAGKGISHTGGKTFAENLYLDTATTTNAAYNPVSVAAAGLILKDCVLIAPAGTDSITAASAQTVTVIGNVYANTAKHANVTIVGPGTFTVLSSLPRL
jgi:hypothetical protein